MSECNMAEEMMSAGHDIILQAAPDAVCLQK